MFISSPGGTPFDYFGKRLKRNKVLFMLQTIIIKEDIINIKTLKNELEKWRRSIKKVHYLYSVKYHDIYQYKTFRKPYDLIKGEPQFRWK